MPSHTHQALCGSGSADNGFGSGSTFGGSVIATTRATGGGAAHNNMPPYLAVYAWKRTA